MSARKDRSGRRLKAPSFSTLIRRDLRGRAFRTIASGTAVGVMVGALFVTLLLTTGANYSIEQARNKLGADVMVIPRGSAPSTQPFFTLVYTPTDSYMSSSETRNIAAVQGVKAATPQVFLAEFGQAGGDVGQPVFNVIIAIDPHNNFMLKSWLPANITNPLAGDTTILGADLPPWDVIPGGGRFFGVKLITQFRLAPTGTFMDRVVFVSMDTAARMQQWQARHPGVGDPSFIAPLNVPQGAISAVFVKLNDGVNPDLAAQAISAQIPNVQVFTFNSLVRSASTRFAGLLSQFSISGALVWGGAVLLVSATTSLAINERKAEFGLIRALGASKNFIRRLVTTQTIVVTGVAGSMGVLGALVLFYSLYTRIITTLGVPYATPPVTQLGGLILLALLVSVFTGVVAALWPARVASGMEPYDALRRGER
ncbi:MAG: ABC transporter permease [Thaumarchaeota archaeon]|nr:ABC transporter permease [Nitrososphaerota archaeon]